MGLGKTYSTQYLLDSNNSSGVAGQVLSTTSTGIDWVDANTVPGTGLWLANGNDIYNSNSGNVGIGTTSPSEKLEVSGSNTLSIKLSRNNTDAVYVTTLTNNYSASLGTELKSGTYNILTHGNGTGTALNFTNGVMTFDYRNSEYMRITSAGNVGIGTTSPGSKLTVNETGTATAALNIVTARYGISLQGAGTSNTQYLLNLQSNGGSTDVMRVQSSGNVGIGTTAPLVKLQVYGNAMPATGDAASVEDIFTLYRNGSATVWAGGATLALGRYSTGGGTSPKSRLDFKLKDAAGSNTALPETTVMTMQSNGNVGIGTVSPVAKLHINAGTSNTVGYFESTDARSRIVLKDNSGEVHLNAIGDNITFETSASGTERMRINSSGNVGIGTTGPLEPLSVFAGENESVYDVLGVYNSITGTSAAGKGAAIRIGNDVNGNYSTKIATIYEDNNPSFLQPAMAFFTMRNTYLKGSEVERMRITSAGTLLLKSGAFPTNQDAPFLYRIGGGSLAIGSATETGSGAHVALYTNSLERMRILANGTILIGSTIDFSDGNADDLQIGNTTGSHGVSIMSQNNAVSSIYFGDNDNNDAGIINYEHGLNQLRFVTNRAQKMVIDSSGNVGIGTTTPGEPLTVKTKTAAYYPGIKIEDYNSSMGLYVQNIEGGNSGIGTGRYYNSSLWRSDVTAPTAIRLDEGVIRFYAQSGVTADTNYTPTERMRISSAGAIKFNAYDSTNQTGTPTYLLGTDASGNVVKTLSSSAPGSLWAASGNDIYNTNSANVGIGITNPTSLLHIDPSAAVETEVKIVGGGSSGQRYTGPWLSLTRKGPYDDYGIKYYTESTLNWFVGVPYQGGSGDSYQKFIIGTSATAGTGTVATFDYQGNVGIGTTSPERKLHVFAGESNGAASNAQSTLVLENSTNTYLQFLTPASSESGILFGDTDNDRGGLTYSHSTDAMNFRIAATTKMIITSAGNVGIGTTLPQSKLQANGGDGLTVTANDTAYSNGYFGRIQSDYGTNPLRLVSRSGDVFRATAFGAAVSILTGPTSGTSEKLRITSAGGVSFGSTGTAYGTSGQILKSNGNASPTWIDGSAIPGVPAGSGTTNYLAKWTPDGDTLGIGVVYDNGTNVGIGTISPDSKLDVTGGDITVNTSGIGFMNFKYGSVGSEGVIGSIQTDGIDLKINATSDLLLLPGSNVGIGTTLPGRKLTVTGDASGDANNLLLANENDTDGDSASIGFSMLSNNTYVKSGIFFKRTTTQGRGDLIFANNNEVNGNNVTLSDAKITIQPAGNVGIGTDSPGALLHLVGTTPELRIATAADGQTARLGLYEDAAGTHHGGYIQYVGGGDTLSLGIVNSTVNTDVITIKDNFNVGIGTTSPAHTLDVRGPDTDNAIIARFYSSEGSRGDFIIRNGSSTAPTTYIGTGGGSEELSIGTEDTNAIYIDNQQRVGIGTTGPGQKLDVSGNIASNSIYLYDSTSNDRLVLDLDGSDNLQISTGTSTGSRGITFFTENSEKMRILSGGNVGIGLTNPAVPLDVEGKIRSTNDNSGSYLEMFNDGDVSGNSFIKSTSGELIIESAADITFSPNSSEKMRITSTGDIELAASSRIVLDDQPTASTASGSGTIVKWSVSESTTAGTLYAVKSNGGWTTTDADIELRSIGMLGIALGSNATAGMLLQGFFYKSAHGFTIGLPLYISNTPGAFSTTRPTGANDYVRIIGYATSANYIYFDPDKTWVQVA